jgi:hypothetical protein
MDDLAPAPAAPVETGETGEPRVPGLLYALKDKDTFVVADSFGDILGAGDGLFHNDTRLVSKLQLLLGGKRPSLLSAAVAQDNIFFTSHGRPACCTSSASGSSIPSGSTSASPSSTTAATR